MNKNPEKFAIEYLIRNGFKLEEDYNNFARQVVRISVEDLEKQIAKKPILLTYLPLIQSGWKYACPSCKLAVGVNSYSFDYTDEDEYCPSCGQKLNWD